MEIIHREKFNVIIPAEGLYLYWNGNIIKEIDAPLDRNIEQMFNECSEITEEEKIRIEEEHKQRELEENLQDMDKES